MTVAPAWGAGMSGMVFQQVAQRLSWPIGLLAVMLVLALWPHDPIPHVMENQDKVHHLAGFAILAYALLRRRHNVVGRAVGIVILAVGIEYAQSIIGTRSADLGDATASLIGACLGAGWTVVMGPAHTADKRHHRARLRSRRRSFQPSRA